MSATALLFWLAPQWVVGAYLDVSAPENQAVVTLTMELLILAGLFQVVDGVQAAAAGGLRGCKDTTVPMVLVFISYWLIGLTTGYWLAFKLGMGAHGLWWGLVTGLTLASLLLTIRLHRHFSRRSEGLAKNA
jgi:MATE family multidrug resistance protein